MSSDNRPLVVFGLLVALTAFLAYLVVSRSSDALQALVGVWALLGAPIGAAVAYFFHSSAAGQGASISAAGATSALAAAAGQPTAIDTGGGNITTTGRPLSGS